MAVSGGAVAVLMFGLAILPAWGIEPLGKSVPHSLSVIAVEYPPFTTQSQPDNGSNFKVLQQYLNTIGAELTVLPRFLPTARAQATIIDGDWCASFYPPPDSVTDRANFIVLSTQKVQLGLFRKAQPEPFVWQALSELAGGKVAVLRSKVDGHFIRQFIDAGMTLEYVNDVTGGLRMLQHGRVDYAFGDSNALLISGMNAYEQSQLQFSESLLLQAPIGLFINPKCSVTDILQP